MKDISTTRKAVLSGLRTRGGVLCADCSTGFWNWTSSSVTRTVRYELRREPVALGTRTNSPLLWGSGYHVLFAAATKSSDAVSPRRWFIRSMASVTSSRACLARHSAIAWV